MSRNLQPKKLYRKGQNVYLMDTFPGDIYTDIDSEDVNNYEFIVKQIEDKSGDPAQQIKLLKYYSQLNGLSMNQQSDLAEAAGMKMIKKSELDALSQNVCQAMFSKFLKRYESIVDFTQENWTSFKIEEFKKIVKNGFQNIVVPSQFTLALISITCTDKNVDITENATPVNELADKDKTALTKYIKDIKPVIKHFNGELQKCMKKYLKSQGESSLGAYTQQDGRRHRLSHKRSHKRSRHSDGKKKIGQCAKFSKLNKKTGRCVPRHSDGKKSKKFGKSGKKSKSLRRRFDGVKSWLKKLRTKSKSRRKH